MPETPDTLRELGNEKLPPEDDVQANYALIGKLREAARTSAAAWEADRKQLEAVEKVRDGAASVPPEEFEERPEYWWQKVVGDLTAALAAGDTDG